jgi:two-component system chemotaxis sensor kinase CheA
VGRILGFRDARRRPDQGRGGPGGEARRRPRAALLVDAIQGQRQVVIKSLEQTNNRHVDGIAAATILGDGRVALILDVDALVIAGSRAGAEDAPQFLKMAS